MTIGQFFNLRCKPLNTHWKGSYDHLEQSYKSGGTVIIFTQNYFLDSIHHYHRQHIHQPIQPKNEKTDTIVDWFFIEPMLWKKTFKYLDGLWNTRNIIVYSRIEDLWHHYFHAFYNAAQKIFQTRTFDNW